MDPNAQSIVHSTFKGMLESAATNLFGSMKKTKKTSYCPQEYNPTFFVSKEDMSNFLTKELAVTVITKSSEESDTQYDQPRADSYDQLTQGANSQSMGAQHTSSVQKNLILRARKNFRFRIYPEKRISKTKRTAAGGSAGAATGGVVGGVTGGVAGGMGGAVLGGFVGAVAGTLVFPVVGTILGGIGGAIVGGAGGVAAGGVAGAGAGTGAGMAIGAGAGATNAEYEKKKAVIMTAEDIFRCGVGYQEDEEYVYCTMPVTPPSGNKVDGTAGDDHPVAMMPATMPGAPVNHHGGYPLQQQPLQQSTEIAGEPQGVSPTTAVRDEDVKQLQEMFPTMEGEIIRSVLEASDGQVDAATTTLLEMTAH